MADNLKPELKKYSYDSLMTDSLQKSQDNLVKFGRRKAWDEVIEFVKTEIVPVLQKGNDFWAADYVVEKLVEKRKTLD
jgi:hypothetical protein